MTGELTHTNKMKHSVIMMVYLGDYPRAASNREYKYIRAVQSFIDNTYQNKELVIVSDGCEKSYEIYKQKFKDLLNIKFILAPKQPKGYPGFLRQIGIYFSEGEIISYLDSDDYLSPNHITNIMYNFNDDLDLVYYDSLTVDILNEFKHLKEIKDHSIINELKVYRWTRLPCTFDKGKIGTGSISHKRDLSKTWKNWNGSSGESEDWIFIKQWATCRIKKIEQDSYYMCHYDTGDKNRLVDI